MWFHMTAKRHQPEKEKETDEDKAQSTFKDQLVVHVIDFVECKAFPALASAMAGIYAQHIYHCPKRKRVENQQLVRQIFQEIAPSEWFATLRQVIPETREIIINLPQNMWRKQGQSQEAGYPELTVFQQFKVG